MSLFKDLLIVEVCEGVVGPACGMQFADLGARVIKIETASGDRSREWGAGEGDSAIFRSLNRGKESLVIDPASVVDRALLARIAATADAMLVQNDPADPDGLDWRAIAAANPHLIVCEIDGEAASNPFANFALSELAVQAMSGFTRYVGQPGGAPVRVGYEIAGTATAMTAFHAIAAALFHRNRSGSGQYVSISSLASLLAMKSILFTAQGSVVDSFAGFHVLGPHWPPEVGWKTKDGQITFDFRREQRDKWVAFCEAVGLGRLTSDPDYQDWHSTLHIGDRRFEYGHPYRELFGRMTSAEASQLVNDAGGTSVKFQDYDEVLAHPQVQTLEPLVDVTGPGGAEKQIGQPFRYDGEVRKTKFAGAPALGSSSHSIRAEFLGGTQ